VSGARPFLSYAIFLRNARDRTFPTVPLVRQDHSAFPEIARPLPNRSGFDLEYTSDLVRFVEFPPINDVLQLFVTSVQFLFAHNFKIIFDFVFVRKFTTFTMFTGTKQPPMNERLRR
jgi:hypothetical protein